MLHPRFLLLVSFSGIKGKKMVLFYHWEATGRQRNAMTGRMSGEAFLKGGHLHAALVGFLKGFFKLCTVASLKRLPAACPL